ncbi:unnamed protein product [Fraxinus pennsylvanica]|uniref:DUF4378 domain-containing protein n=1 Tax=Fraxinus pennsylvanica TaxID=56036 RepID=A0AAD2E003_9LAMI|nr:unnamed protein product [Fraxinus pennsylvanica]
MGKEWLHWGGGGRSTKRGRISDVKEASPSGCMCAVFQIFDLHHFQFPLHHHHSSHFHTHSLFQEEDTTVLKGVEAPRNSLALEECPMDAAASLSLAMKEDENSNFPMGIRIKTGRENKSPRVSTSDYISSECSISPGTKTPNLVARLMGLDLLPESTSPSLSSNSRTVKKSQFHPRGHLNSGVRSLPETPRISSARRSDVEHRLSLQIDKENFCEEIEFKKMGTRREFKKEDENKNQGQYAKQIVKQIKENISRKVGTDITNAIRNSEMRRDEHLVLLKPRNSSRILTGLEDESRPGKGSNPSRILTGESTPGKQPNPLKILTGFDNESRPGKQPKPSFSSGLRFLESKNKPVENSIHKCKKVASDKYDSSAKKPPQASYAIRNKKEEPFIRSAKSNLSDKKNKKNTPLSNEFLNIKTDPSRPTPSPQNVKLAKFEDGSCNFTSQVSDVLSSKKSTQLSSCPSPSYNQETFNPENIKQDKRNGAPTFGDRDYTQYIQKILKRTGIIDNGAPVSLAKWYSASHPLDPSIFHHLELLHPTVSTPKQSKFLNQRCNRKLIFQLVNELLVEILKPRTTRSCRLSGSDLIDRLGEKIQNFPSANCQVLEDIDALIDTDLCKSSSSNGFYEEEEGDTVVSDIDRRILDSLVHETVTVLYDTMRSVKCKNMF